MNRRESLKALGLIAAGSGVLATACKQDKAKDAAAAADTEKLPGVQDFEHERNKQLHAERFFTEHEMATITVLADIIIPKDDISGSASEAGVPAFIEFIVKDLPSHKIPMRGGLKWLDVQSQKRYGNAFIKCKEEQQLALIDEIAYPERAKPEMQQGVAFFSLMRDLTSSGFFTSEMGVKDIGYVGNRPGVWTGVPAEVLKEHGFDPEKFFG
ncbi:gluconate 2-dehydrogenase subunit 3-like protein [Sphingobacterium allocomposti]|uniref:Gluconate 2-dehydrogenase subunit 3-like protein n=1 Tax=Sphingobacterium allocomposti TaxID=415956 RepID=A0A5S5DB03_9SPHI|nr:gluconate 2-dehydrogenase subunit 3 family protein [Sphingobacterium composti Yoo et al. 2007 non Ten et al. 2007]TYP91799.1 gluconate 2-dehydrogenase subunit 3-like protein [Sphingobacterium composti Yoo et al. 2007 non Ten et al. 2007]